MKRRLVGLALVLAALGAAAAGLAGFAWHAFTRPGPLAEAKTVVVARGSGVAAIGDALAEAGVVEHPLLVVAGSRLIGGGEPLKAGEYAFPAHVSARAAVEMMQAGRTVVRRLTVAEGLTAAQVVALLGETEGLAGEITLTPAEGSLLPETYHYSLGDSRDSLVLRMQEAMRDTLERLWRERDPDLPLAGKEQAVALASIVEKETGLTDERPLVAAVFLNRLRKGMKLQSDPTVIYGLSGGKGAIDRPLTKADLATPHPYNTYLIDGLPPGPIANPGAAALAAVVRPARTSHLYFVADGTGGHAFADDLDEHNRNVAKWRRIERGRAAGR